MERDLWDELFDELYLMTYAFRIDQRDSAPEALGAAALAGVEPGSDVLDVPCGYARHSIPLAAAGYRVTGADRSEVMLEEARRRADGGEWPRFVHADMRELPFADASFDAVLNLFSSLGYRGEEGDRQALGEFRRVLRPGGALVIETMHRDRLMRIFQPEDWSELADGDLLLERREFHQLEGEVEALHQLVRADGTRQAVTYRIRTYTATELAAVARSAGFTEIEAFGDLERADLVPDSRLVLVAR
jgi:ubiquinone/menaquinone biosynthesis C-methylase UbiE